MVVKRHGWRRWRSSRGEFLFRRRLFETHLSPSDGLGHPRGQPLGVVVKLGRVVDWFAVSEFKLGNPNRTPRMDLRVGLGNFILLMLFLSTVFLPLSLKKSFNRQVPIDLPQTLQNAGWLAG